MKLGDGGFILPGRKLFLFLSLGLMGGFVTVVFVVAFGLLRTKDLVSVLFVDQVYTEDNSLEGLAWDAWTMELLRCWTGWACESRSPNKTIVDLSLTQNASTVSRRHRVWCNTNS